MEIGDLIQKIYDIVYGYLLMPLITDRRFASGFCYGVILSGVFGFIGLKILYWRGKILNFFKATKLPATRDGPTPVGILGAALAQPSNWPVWGFSQF